MDQDSNSDSQQNEEIGQLVIPKNLKDLKACANCGLILNTTQWKDMDEQCPNGCDSKPTKNYEGVMSLMNPRKSWAAKRIGVRKQDIIPGIYAVEIYDN